ncbi:MAG: hypothetical protein F4X56_09210 [Gammaproteobacteria bacterium]|nr:hypothetical protein [Gammaproteobacteria bacterium]
MNGQNVWHATVHEMRTLRRLLRTHVCFCGALLISASYFLAVTITHMQEGTEVPMFSVISPRYVMSLLSGSFLALFCGGILLLTFDQVKRDEVTRIHEVVSSKPVSNFELLTGRLLGVSISVAIPMLAFLVSIMTYGMIADVFSIKFGEPVEFWSVVSFVFLDIFPNFLFFGSLVVLFSMLFKSRLLALILTLSGLIAVFWINSRLPLHLSKPIQTVTGNVLFPTELTPEIFTPATLFNRIALIAMSIGMLQWASSFATRVTPTRFRHLVIGSLAFCFGLIVIGTMFGVQALQNNQIQRWVQTHDEHFNPSAFPNVHEIRGSVVIKPGRALTIDLKLDVSVDVTQDVDFILFSLNPDYKISRLAVAGERVTDQKFEHGLLKIPQHYFNSDLNELEIFATGRPNSRFAYLDTVDTLSKIVGPDVRQLRQLGTENAIFHSNFVVLSPGIKWYPTSGTATNEDAWELRKRDFFTLKIDVSVPRHWLVAGPAKRETLDDGKRSVFRFEQSSPIPEFALVSSRFKSASVEVEGISFECLYAKMHRRKFEWFSGNPADQIQERVSGSLNSLRNLGLEYPYGALTLVEVPSTLRVFGGGFEMDTVMHPPGLTMIRESTLPTTRVDLIFEGTREEIMEQYKMSEQRFIGFELNSMTRYLDDPMFESNYHTGFFRSSSIQQTSATGDGASVLNALIDFLIRSMDRRADTRFDLHTSLNRKILNLSSVDPIQRLRSIRQGRSRWNTSEEMQKKQMVIHNAPEVWDAVATIGVFDTVGTKNSKLKLRALKFRSQQLARLVQDALGRNNIGPFVADVISRFRGKTLTFTEFDAVMGDHGVKLSELAGGMIGSQKLPGFLVSNPTSRQLAGDEQPQYESDFVLENRESVSGPVKLSLTYQNGKDRFGRTGPSFTFHPVLVGANQSLQIVIESANPVEYIWVKPYLSLNRMNLRVDMPESDRLSELEFVPDADPLIKSIVVIEQIEDAMNRSITVDDLDPGFSIVELDRTSDRSNVFLDFFRRFLGKEEILMDQGLPKYSMFDRWRFQGWSRWTDPTAFGTYRRTFAIADRGDGLSFAKFNTKLPSAGNWELEYFLPKGHFNEEYELVRSSSSTGSSKRDGPLYIEVQNSSTATNHTIDVPNLSPGWHSIGTFDMLAEEVIVLVSDKSDERGADVIADAIRWTLIDTEE